jgi:hypothetical protein
VKDRQVLTLIRRQPGMTFRGLNRVVGGPHATLRRRLDALLQGKRIREVREGTAKRYFPGSVRPASRDIALLNPPLAELASWISQQLAARKGRDSQILAQNRVGQAYIVHHFAQQGWAKSTTKHRLGRLIKAEVIDECRHELTPRNFGIHYKLHSQPGCGLISMYEADLLAGNRDRYR